MLLTPEERMRRVDEMTTMNSEGQSGINMGAADDSMNMFQQAGNFVKPPQIFWTDERT